MHMSGHDRESRDNKFIKTSDKNFCLKLTSVLFILSSIVLVQHWKSLFQYTYLQFQKPNTWQTIEDLYTT